MKLCICYIKIKWSDKAISFPQYKAWLYSTVAKKIAWDEDRMLLVTVFLHPTNKKLDANYNFPIKWQD